MIDNDYLKFLENKKHKVINSGFEVSVLNANLFEFQQFIVKRALRAGRYAIFADCGLGKTLMQLEWAFRVSEHTNKPVLIIAPLAVVNQTIKEGEKFGIKVLEASLSGNAHYAPIQITNYEQLSNIDTDIYSGVVLDESSILKNYTGATKELIIELFISTPYKLACTATPSPNDELEIGNHSEFLGVMTSMDMRALYFVTDKEIVKGNKYRIKQHAKKDFYEWISSWATMITKPSDLGFLDEGYELPAIKYIEHQIVTDKKSNGLLFNDISVSATTFNKELRLTQKERMSKVASIVNDSKESFIVWVKHDEEGTFLKGLIKDAVEVKGSDKSDYKKNKLLGFANNEFRVLITKSKIAQFGLNYQNCHNQVFASLDFSFESLYQSIRRSYRFGQKENVNIYIITTDTMQNVINSIKEKETKFLQMQNELSSMINKKDKKIANNKLNIVETKFTKLYHGDCVDVTKTFDDNSIDYTFFSPPFGAMYVFSDDPRDMSNVHDNDEFFKHFSYLVDELYRVTKSGRLCTLHIMQSTTLLGRDGFYSIVDFRGEIIRLFQKAGFYFHAENMIRKDPKTAAIRTKNRQLMHGTTKKDSSIVRPGLADYILTFRKKGINEVPIQNNIPFDLWCKIAEPVWLDINEGDTLSYRSAKGDKDERHLTPTQLKPIEYCNLMWSNKGDTVFCPFMGIGSEIYQAVKMGRKGIGIELKSSYFNEAVKNVQSAELSKNQLSLI